MTKVYIDFQQLHPKTKAEENRLHVIRESFMGHAVSWQATCSDFKRKGESGSFIPKMFILKTQPRALTSTCVLLLPAFLYLFMVTVYKT